MRARLSAARSTASVLEALEESIAGRSAEMAAEDARHAAAWASLTALLEETGATDLQGPGAAIERSEEHTSELQSLMRISYAVFCLKTKRKCRHKCDQNTDTPA